MFIWDRAAVSQAVLCGTILFCARESLAQGLQDELKQLLATHPAIESARKSVEASKAAVDEAFSGFLPSVALSGDAGHEYTDSPGRRAGPGSPLSKGRNRIGISVSENVFVGFRDSARLKVAKLNVEIAEQNLDVETQRRIYDGVQAYIDVIRSARLVELARNDEATIHRQLRLEDERVKKGSGIGVDVLLAKARLQVAKERRVVFQGRLRQAIDRYDRLFGHMVDPSGLTEPVPPLDLMPTSLEDAIGAALEKNPNLVASERTVDVNGLQREIAAADYYPRVDVVGRGNREDNVDGVEGLRKDWSVLVEARWELYSGFRTEARVSRATIAHAASKDDHSDVNRQVVEEVRLAWDTLNTTRERVDLLNNAVTIAAEVFEARDKLWRAGKESTLNVLDAQREVYNARINLADARFESLTVVYRVLLALGRLSPTHLGFATAE